MSKTYTRKSAQRIHEIVQNTEWLRFCAGEVVPGAIVLGFLAIDPKAYVRNVYSNRVITRNEYLVFVDEEGYYGFVEIPS